MSGGLKLLDSTDLCGLWYDLGGDYELQKHLAPMAAANRAAWLLSYGFAELNDVHPEIDNLGVHALPAIDEPVEKTEGWRPPPVAWVKNVAYNCVAMDGTDFAPRVALEALMRAAMEVEARGRAQESARKTAEQHGKVTHAMVENGRQIIAPSVEIESEGDD